ncbi:MAG: hypothetical protein M1831_006956 [Alyxoria varia]|nr:MAG: hypothetical protein M1831_006956 [Alyxoria varia]
MQQSGYQNTILGVTWALTVTATLLVGLRLLTRLKIKKFAGYDDVAIVWSLFLVLVTAAIYTYASTLGLGRHQDQLTAEEALYSQKWYYICSVILDQIYAWPKLSVVILLHRIFTPKPVTLSIFYSLTIGLIIYTIILSPFELTRCDPIEGLWNPEVEAECWSPKKFADFCIPTGPWSAFLDFLFALYPVKVFWSLEMSVKRKIGLSVLMGLGVFAGVIAIIKTVQLPRLNHTTDLTYGFGIIALWSFIEADVVIIAASVPTLGSLATVAIQHSSIVSKIPSSLRPSNFRNIPSSRGSQSMELQGSGGEDGKKKGDGKGGYKLETIGGSGGKGSEAVAMGGMGKKGGGGTFAGLDTASDEEMGMGVGTDVPGTARTAAMNEESAAAAADGVGGEKIMKTTDISIQLEQNKNSNGGKADADRRKDGGSGREPPQKKGGWNWESGFYG